MGTRHFTGSLRGCRLTLPILLVLAAAGLCTDELGRAQGPGQVKANAQAAQFPGVIEASEETSVYARVIGYVQRVNVDIGDRVKKDQILAELSTPELEAELRQKMALVAQAEAETELARGRLKATEAEAAVATAHVDEAEAGVRRAQANHDRWKTEYKRIEKLWDSKVIEKQVRDEALHRFEEAKAALIEAQAKIKAAKAGRDANLVKRDLSQAEIKVAQARQDLAKAEV